MKLCGTQNCILEGSTCCDNVGYPELDCPNSGICSDDGTCINSCQLNTDFSCTIGSAYYCSGTASPAIKDPSLRCSEPYQDIGAIIFCCE